MKILKDSYKEAKRMLKDNRKVMDKLAAYLIEKETITGKEFMEIFRKEKGLPEPEKKEGEKPEAEKKAEEEIVVTAAPVPMDEAVIVSMPQPVAEKEKDETSINQEAEQQDKEQKPEGEKDTTRGVFSNSTFES